MFIVIWKLACGKCPERSQNRDHKTYLARVKSDRHVLAHSILDCLMLKRLFKTWSLHVRLRILVFKLRIV